MPKVKWEEGTVYARHTDENGFVTYHEHRAWNMTEFCKNQSAHAAILNDEIRKKTKGRDQGEAKFERITKEDYDNAIRLQRKHK